MSRLPEITERDQARAQAWLLKHRRPGRPPTPLLTARIAVRRRAARFEQAAGLIMMVGFAGWGFAGIAAGDEPSGLDSGPALLGAFVAGYAVLALGSLAALWYQRRGDRRIGDTLRQRVARPVTPDLRSMLGGWFLAGHTAIYAGGVLAGLAAAVTAPDAAQQAVALVFVVAVLFFAGVAVAVLTDVANRPAVAEDADTLVDDDLLRRQDARSRSSAPYVMALALIAGAFGSDGPMFELMMGYAVVAIPVWFWVVYASCRRHSPAAPPGVPAAVGQ
jgi:hypothetical protein